MSSVRRAVEQAFGCDLRSLAVFRIALGAILIADIAWRVPLIDSLFSNAGAWPLSAAIGSMPYSWSFYHLSDSAWLTWALLGFATIAAIALMLGWRTRIATVVSWALLASLQTRNTLVLNGGDAFLRLILFWAMFLPLGACWSLDAKRGGTRTGRIANAATAALLVQVALIYIFNAIYKTSPTWRETYEATSLALSLETYSTPFARWLLGFPDLLKVATRCVWWWELLGPLLAFVPWKSNVFRLIAALGFIGFHAFLLLTLRIGLFPIIGIIAWIPLLPSSAWDWIPRSRIQQSDTHSARLPVCAQWAVGILLAYVLTWNVWDYYQRPPLAFRRPGYALHLQQKWALFSPGPARSEGRMVAVIETSEGIGYDAFTGHIVDWKRPADLGAALPTAQWRKYLATTRDLKHPERARLLAEWLRRDWQQRHPEHTVVRVRLHYLWEWIASRQSPPDNWLIYEDPPGPIGEMARAAGGQPIPPVDTSDN